MVRRARRARSVPRPPVAAGVTVLFPPPPPPPLRACGRACCCLLTRTPPRLILLLLPVRRLLPLQISKSSERAKAHCMAQDAADLRSSHTRARCSTREYIDALKCPCVSAGSNYPATLSCRAPRCRYTVGCSASLKDSALCINFDTSTVLATSIIFRHAALSGVHQPGDQVRS